MRSQSWVYNSETALWQEIKKGNKDAFDRTIRNNYAHLFNYGLKIFQDDAVVDDCIQELFIYIWEHREGLSDVKVVKAYLMKSLRRRLVNYVTIRNKKFVQGSDHYENDINADAIAFSPEEFLIQNEDDAEVQARLAQALNKLPERQKEAIYLKYYSGLSYGEIANILNMENQSVANLLRRALQSLRTLYTVFVPILMELFD